MIGRSPETGEMLSSFAEQAHQALRNLGALLQEAGVPSGPSEPRVIVFSSGPGCKFNFSP